MSDICTHPIMDVRRWELESQTIMGLEEYFIISLIQVTSPEH